MPKIERGEKSARLESAQRCDRCPIRTLTLYWQSDTRLADAIMGLRKATRTVRARRFVARPDEVTDEVFSVFSGWGAVTKIGTEGQRSIVAFVMASDFIGLPLFEARPGLYGVQAISDMELCVFDRAALAAFVRKTPQLSDRLEAWLILQLNQSYSRAENMGRRSAQERVAHLVLELYRRQERLGLLRNGTLVSPLRQRDLADALGLTAVHVSRVLTSLKDDGLIEGALSELRILDRRRLRALAGLPSDRPEFTHYQMAGVADIGRIGR